MAKCVSCGNETTAYVQRKKPGTSGKDQGDYEIFCLSDKREESCWGKFINNANKAA